MNQYIAWNRQMLRPAKQSGQIIWEARKKGRAQKEVKPQCPYRSQCKANRRLSFHPSARALRIAAHGDRWYFVLIPTVATTALTDLARDKRNRAWRGLRGAVAIAG